MTDLDVIERVRTMFPACQNVSPVQAKPVRESYSIPKVRHVWRVSDPKEVRRITELILPYLGERRTAKAKEVLEHLANRPGMGSNMRNRTHCPLGHPYDEANTVWGRDGNAHYRRCRACLKIWNDRSVAKRRLLRVRSFLPDSASLPSMQTGL